MLPRAQLRCLSLASLLSLPPCSALCTAQPARYSMRRSTDDAVKARAGQGAVCSPSAAVFVDGLRASSLSSGAAVSASPCMPRSRRRRGSCVSFCRPSRVCCRSRRVMPQLMQYGMRERVERRRQPQRLPGPAPLLHPPPPPTAHALATLSPTRDIANAGRVNASIFAAAQRRVTFSLSLVSGAQLSLSNGSYHTAAHTAVCGYFCDDYAWCV